MTFQGPTGAPALNFHWKDLSTATLDKFDFGLVTKGLFVSINIITCNWLLLMMHRDGYGRNMPKGKDRMQ